MKEGKWLKSLENACFFAVCRSSLLELFKVGFPMAMQRDLRQRRCTIYDSDFYFCISKACGTAQFLTPFFSFRILWLRHFRQRYRGDLRFELLSVKAIKIATLHAAKLHSY
jgi:hypothetical protein